jgi:16S rRNA (guanine527-N7)-methyltransferase
MAAHPSLTEILSKLEIDYPASAPDRLKDFRSYLTEVNSRINLVSRIDTAAVVLEQIYDSLAILKLVDYTNGVHLLDIGSGAGFPWIIHKIIRTDLRVTTVDSNRRKIEFQRSAARRLSLSDCEFVAARVEDLKPVGADYATAKAFGTVELIATVSGPHLKSGGRLILPRIGSEPEIEAPTGFVIESVLDYRSLRDRLSRLLILKKS